MVLNHGKILLKVLKKNKIAARKIFLWDLLKKGVIASTITPFKFDVHAMIFSEDAPTLENELHHTFEEYRLNKLNKRREFFRVPLSKIESVVKRHHAKEVEFEELAYAEEFRQSLKMK